ncbi:MAG: hypothetical protein JST92_17425, partial [Deltaproteobacteria bacterium]|nr:hypothetical protein [Deltaproteobacteria bacterium]
HWTITAPSTPFAGAVSGAVLGNQMWIVDGAGVTYSSPDGETWSTLGQVPLGGAALLDAALLGSGTSLFVVGGSVGGVDRANVFVSSATP